MRESSLVGMRIPHKCLWWDDKNRRKEEATNLGSLDVASSNVSPSSDAQNEQTQLSHPALFIEESSNGRTAGFDPAYRGSNPCTSANLGERRSWRVASDCKSAAIG